MPETHQMQDTTEMTQLIGEVTKISFRNEENGWSVVRIQPEESTNQVTVTGDFTRIEEGEYIELIGQWSQHRTYGRQFKSIRKVPPTTSAGIERYLSSRLIKGIGKVTANKIVDHFGSDTLEILDQYPHRLTEVGSIGKKKTNSIIASWNQNKTSRATELFLLNNGLSPKLAIQIIRKYGDDTIKVISANPFQLAVDISGIGFLSADRVAQHIGLECDSPERIKAAIIYLLEQAEDNGHCYLTTNQIISKLADTLNLDEEKLAPIMADCLKDLNQSGSIISEKFKMKNQDVTSSHYRADLLLAETRVANKIQALINNPLKNERERIIAWTEKFSEKSGISLSEGQLLAIVKAASERFFILTGGPGVGKTTTANTIIRLLKAMGKTVALAAPTGRAAQRLTEVSALEAKTIHRLLQWTPQNNGFSKDEDNPINAQAIVIDEASMIDLRLAASLLDAIATNTQIILIGDTDQLPSVGAGNFLRDLIDSNQIPFYRLTDIFRQAETSQIIKTAHQINSGKVPSFSNDKFSDCRFIEVESPDAIKGVIKDLVSDKLPSLGKFDSIKDIQVLSPMNRGELGTVAINESMQELLNPKRKNVPELKRDKYALRPGDKVIQSTNNYELSVFNGDIGYVEHTGVQGGKIIVSYSGKTVTYDSENISEIKLAYGITIHKSQGSEFPVVIIPISMQHYVMLQRNLIYTALTRAKKLAIFVGTKKALAHATGNQVSLNRQTRLIERIMA